MCGASTKHELQLHSTKQTLIFMLKQSTEPMPSVYMITRCFTYIITQIQKNSKTLSEHHFMQKPCHFLYQNSPIFGYLFRMLCALKMRICEKVPTEDCSIYVCKLAYYDNWLQK